MILRSFKISENLKDTEIRTYRAILIGGVGITILAISIAFFIALSIIKPIKMLIISKETFRQVFQDYISKTINTDLFTEKI